MPISKKGKSIKKRLNKKAGAIKRSKFGLDQPGPNLGQGPVSNKCCSQFNKLITEIDAQLNHLVNLRQSYFGNDESESTKNFYKQIQELKNALNGIEKKDLLESGSGGPDITSFLNGMKQALRRSPVDEESLYVNLVSAAKSASGTDVSDVFISNAIRPIDNQQRKVELYKKIDTIATSGNKYDDIVNLYKEMYITGDELPGTF